MATGINRYKADLRDLEFSLLEQFRIQELFDKEPYTEWDPDQVKMILEEVYRFATEVTGPLNRSGDIAGCRLEDGRVITPEGFKNAWTRLYEAGWRTLTMPEEYGGANAPHALGSVVEEMLSGSNTAFNMYPGLCFGAAELILHFGTDEERELYAKRMLSGQWGGTMCLSEPHAGSDVGASKTMAYKQDDGTYKIKGQKVWISGGDHDLAENVIHLVLARIDGAVEGTKGLSLFIVPRVKVNKDGSLGELNDVEVAGIEHKMGINGSATCQLNFGSNDDCVGELVGTVEHQGMRQMFRMMNFARIAVGIQGLAVAGSAYLNALEYARDRKQGSSIKEWKNPGAPRVAIIDHPNVRKDLLHMKAIVEGLRALVVKLSMHEDHARVLAEKDDQGAAYHKGQADLLTPLVKAYASDQAFQICERAIQTFGGAGYTQDWPVEQYCRDAKIFSIYEGTNAIQALDLVGRKLGQKGGANTQAFLGDIQKFIAANKEHAELKDAVENLQKAHEAVAGTVMQFLGWFQGGEMERIPLAAETFLEMMSKLAVGWLLLDGAAIACKALEGLSESDKDHAFYTGKKYAAIYYAMNLLPSVTTSARTLSKGDRSPVEIPDNAFGPV